MPRILIIACATLAFGLAAAPLHAQAQQTAPEAVPPAPPPAAEELPPPPPFPPMPSSRPSHRWVDVGGHHSTSSHKARSTSHHAVRTKVRGRHHATKRASHHKAKPLHFSKKTIRQCHAMTYRQIMKHGSCRALMKQELSASAGRHTARHHHKAAKHSTARHHSAKRRRR